MGDRPINNRFLISLLCLPQGSVPGSILCLVNCYSFLFRRAPHRRYIASLPLTTRTQGHEDPRLSNISIQGQTPGRVRTMSPTPRLTMRQWVSNPITKLAVLCYRPVALRAINRGLYRGN